jgi:hypothetical protein
MPYVINFELTQYKIVLPLGADQRLFDINISGSLNGCLGSESCRPVTGAVIGRKVPFAAIRH